MTEEEYLDALSEELDILLLRRAKLQMLVERLRAVHTRLTRTQRYRPIVRAGDSRLETEYRAPFEERPWQARPRPYSHRGTDPNPKSLWRNAKRPW